jgi:tetratricopeptide (TPR) repeat protein
MDASELEGYIGLWYWYLLNTRAKMHHYRKEFDLAETDARRSLDWARKAESIDSIVFWADLIIMLSQRGEFDMAEVELAELEEHAHRLYPKDLFLYWWARGWLEMERGDTEAACSSLEESVRLEGTQFKAHYSLGLAYLKAGRVEDAVRELELTTRGAHWAERGNPIWSGLSSYHLGRVYEEAGRLKDAATEYDAFLTLFKDADPVFDEVGDARARLERLRPGS